MHSSENQHEEVDDDVQCATVGVVMRVMAYSRER